VTARQRTALLVLMRYHLTTVSNWMIPNEIG
jgi:hypothetical protein